MNYINPASLASLCSLGSSLGSHDSEQVEREGGIVFSLAPSLLGHGLEVAAFLTQGHISYYTAPPSAIALIGF